MKYQPGFTDFFMSPITGRIILPMMPDLNQNYIWIGNRNDRPLPSPIVIDLRLEIIDIRRRLSETRFILQAASQDFDGSQALNELVDGILKHEQGVVSIAIPGTDYLAPILPYQNIWIGNIDNEPQAFPRIQVGNLPTMLNDDPLKLLGAYNLYSGSPNPLTLGEPEVILRVNITNLPDLTVGKLWYGTASSNPLNFGDNRPVEIEVLPLTNMADLPSGKIWRGNVSDRPEPSDALTDVENDIGDINIDIGDINLSLDSLFDHIFDINVELGDINVEIGDINIEIGDINTQIDEINDAIDGIGIDFGDIIERLDGIDITLGDLQAQIDSNVASGLDQIADLQGQIDAGISSGLDHLADLQGQIDSNVASGLGHLADLQAQIDAGISSGMDHLATLNGLIDALDVRVTSLELEVTGILASIVTINSTITTIQGDITAIQGDITILYGYISTINSAITSIEGDITNITTVLIPAIYGYIDDSIGDATIELTGHVTGSGGLDAPIATTLNETISRDGGEIQTFQFSLPIARFRVSGLWEPPPDTITLGIIELSNYLSSGFRLVQTSSLTDINSFGNVTFESFVSSDPGVPIWSYAESANTMNLHVYMDMQNNAIVNLAGPVVGTDGANKGYVDDAISDALIELSGAVTGSAEIGSMPIVTTLNMTLDTIPLAVANVNLNTHKLINVVNPTSAQDAATKNYVDTSIAAGTIVLTGNVTGSGVVGTPLATTLAMSLDQITIAAANVNLNSHKITNLLTPTTGTDAANKSYVDSAIIAGTVVLTGDVTGSGVIGTPISTDLNTTVSVGGATQTFQFTNTASSFYLSNSFVPTALNSNNLYLDFRNNTPNGYRLRQTTTFGGSSTGNFYLDKVISSTPTNLMFYDNSADTFTFVPNTNFSGTVFCNGAAPALRFPNGVLNRKISLHETVSNDHQFFGFGINSGALRYQVGSIGASHIFYAGTSSTTSDEVGKITGGGDLIIPGTSYSTIIHGGLSMVTNATGFTANNTWVKASGTTTLQSGNEFTSPSSNRLTYTGTTQATIKARVSATISWSYSSATADVIYFGIVKNGTPAAYYLPKTNSGLNVFQNTALECVVSLTTNDYVEIWGFSTGASTITPWGMSLSAVRI